VDRRADRARQAARHLTRRAGIVPRRWGAAGASPDVPVAPTFAIATRHDWEALPTVAPDPPDNPTTAVKAGLGERLFADRNLSRNREVACVSCHDLIAGAGVDGLRTASGVEGRTGARNAPTVWNAAFQSRLFWEGRAASLEEQAAGPLLNPLEMDMPSLGEVTHRVAADPAYPPLFAAAFGGDRGITGERIVAAIAAYERTLITPDTAYDRFVRGDTGALTSAQLRGMALFESVGCMLCHSGPNFSAASVFGPIAPYRLFPASKQPLDAGLLADTKIAPRGSEQGVWRVPSLRNVALTAPYFHNGSVTRLEDAVRIMARAQLGLRLESDGPGELAVHCSPSDRVLQTAGSRVLGDREIGDIVAFVGALSSEALAAGHRPAARR